MRVKIGAAAIAIAVVAVVVTSIGTANSAGAPAVRMTSGYMLVKANFNVVAEVLNPTGSKQRVTGHLVAPNSFPSAIDHVIDVGPHSIGQISWACGAVNCDATAIFTSRSARIAYTVRYEDATSVLIDIRPGELQRV